MWLCMVVFLVFLLWLMVHFVCLSSGVYFFFFKQKTAYDMRISDGVQTCALPILDGLGPFSISGNQFTPNGANLMVNQSSGPFFSRAFNHFAGPTLTNDPHVSQTIAQTPAFYRYITQTSTVLGPLVKIGRPVRGERVCKYESITVGAVQ